MIDAMIVLAVSITAITTGIVIHEGTHFVVGLVMGTLEHVSVILPREGLFRAIPVGVVVGHSRRNWPSTLSPVVWLLPFYAIYVLPPNVPPVLYLFGVLSFGLAGGAVILSDLPVALGLIRFDEQEYRRLTLVDYR